MALKDNNSWGPIADLSKRPAPKPSSSPFQMDSGPSTSYQQYDVVGTLTRIRFIISQKEIQRALLVMGVIIGASFFLIIREKLAASAILSQHQPTYRPANDSNAPSTAR